MSRRRRTSSSCSRSSITRSFIAGLTIVSNAPRKGWWIAEEHLDVVLHLVRDAFGGAIIVVDEDGREITHEGDERLEQGRLL